MEKSDINNVKNKMDANDDSCFLLHFIMGTYFGPDLKGEAIKKSALQRIAERLPPYTLDQLAGSHIRASEIEQIYYYLLRKADRSNVVKLHILNEFIQGSSTSRGENFLTLFPSHLHPQSESLNHSRIVANVVFIRNPAIFYIRSEDTERFKRLTGLEDIFIETQLPNGAFLGDELDGDGDDDDDDNSEEVPLLRYYRACQRKRRLDEILEADDPKPPQQLQESLELALPPSAKVVRSEAIDGPGIVILPSRPSREELGRIVEIAKNAYAVTGSAAKGLVGPVIGLMDIAESKDS